MKKRIRTRRHFLKASATGLVGAGLAVPTAVRAQNVVRDQWGTPAILGGKPVLSGKWPAPWPVYNANTAPKYLGDVLTNSKWTQLSGDYVRRFEKALAERYGARYCFTTNTGSEGLDCALNGCEIGPGDEVLVPAYTFISGINMPFNNYALPVLVDIEEDTFQIDPKLIEQKITGQTRAIMLCHYSGSSANMDAIMAIARKHNLRVIEDACLTAIGEWRGGKLGTIGDAGVVSHQQSKMVPVGEGGHVMSNDEGVYQRAYGWHDYGRKVDAATGLPAKGALGSIGLNFKMTEFQGAIGLANLEIWDEQMRRREAGGKYLDQVLPTIPGISVQRHYPETTRASYYYALMRYDRNHFNGLPVDKFVKAAQAEGIPITEDESPKRDEPFLQRTLESRAFRAIYSKEKLEWLRQTWDCPVTQRMCRDGILRIFGHYLITDQATLDAIPEAIRKVQHHSALLAERLGKT
ncbi:MAG TPA: DegT/DnrJ/EryC1/StrS family aminotransferase [Bryobacteraceae bacterium]|nr:DegT/DnrJ/EryC1/StrS family aminotransferase [Bryobacteraceae bacterium]